MSCIGERARELRARHRYQWRGKKLNAGWVATFNEYAIVAENRVTAIPADSDMEVAALLAVR